MEINARRSIVSLIKKKRELKLSGEAESQLREMHYDLCRAGFYRHYETHRAEGGHNFYPLSEAARILTEYGSANECI